MPAINHHIEVTQQRDLNFLGLRSSPIKEKKEREGGCMLSQLLSHLSNPTLLFFEHCLGMRGWAMKSGKTTRLRLTSRGVVAPKLAVLAQHFPSSLKTGH